MTTKKNSKKAATKTRRDIAQEVTDRIIESLEAGVAPWAMPWNGVAGFSGPRTLPCNATTGRMYRGVNILLLWAAGYSDPRFLTFKQAKACGGSVRRGERGTPIVFWSFVEKEVEGREEKQKIGFLKSYTVFNVAQCEGLDESKILGGASEPAPNPGTVADDTAAANGAVVHRRGNQACFIPSTDEIHVPAREAFLSESGYAATLLHELVHWTGSSERLDRTFGKRFGDQAYAAEELVAELGSAFLCAMLGVEGHLQHAEYMASWIDVMKADKRAVFTAATAAQKAADFLLDAEGRGQENGQENGGEAPALAAA